MNHVRDAAMTALIFGFFASAWFGWAQEAPPVAWKKRLGIAGGVSIAVSLAGGILAWQHWSDGSALSEPGAMRRYGIIVGIECVAAAAGALVLGLRGKRELIAPWICLVVGVHFIPLAGPLQSPILFPLAVAMTLVAAGATPLARKRDIPPSATTGVGAGVSLLTCAIAALIIAVTR
ncbi:hypothetical protein Cme02nite_66480 [Catellatospora methionotrophica]|uniref:Uncharacterized protein n=1 Tax=Catellatospora methionotrophica TaxID=121620 RepID=A0A8J3PHX1_9ACTN|nr:hypothetical protein [Catellatospora methionotrophica]GIG18316.1 hypothetical protein Cme02nite_66480 [Catellatospora methionotrophica]